MSIICIGVIACCGILFVCHCDNTDSYINQVIATDYFLTSVDTRSDGIRTDNEVVDEKDIEKVERLKDYEKGGRLYHNLNQKRCSLRTDKLPSKSRFPLFEQQEFEKNEFGRYFVNLYGADDFVVNLMNVYEGKIDYDLLATGNYIIYGLEREPGVLAYQGEIKDDWKYYKVGDKITIEGKEKTKEYEIMAICIIEHTYADNASYSYPGHELAFYLPIKEYLTICKDLPMRFLFETKDHKNIDHEIGGISFESKNGWRETYLAEEDMIKDSSRLFALCCILVGGFTYVNMLIISFLDRKREFEILEKIGMSSLQMRNMILGEGAIYGTLIMGISIIGTILMEFVGKCLMTNECWCFRWDLLPVVISTIVICALSIVIPLILYQKIKRSS